MMMQYQYAMTPETNRFNPRNAVFLFKKRETFYALFALVLSAFTFVCAPPNKAHAQATDTYSAQEILNSGHRFFGTTTGSLAMVIQRIFSKYGLPNGYILGEEGSGALIGGLTYGEGALYTKNAGDHRVYWQGPSIGWDFGGQGSRAMMLVYNLDAIPNLYRRFVGVSGSAYAIAGVGFHVLRNRHVTLVPVKTGLGARLGLNVGYLKLTQKPTWNPF